MNLSRTIISIALLLLSSSILSEEIRFTEDDIDNLMISIGGNNGVGINFENGYFSTDENNQITYGYAFVTFQSYRIGENECIAKQFNLQAKLNSEAILEWDVLASIEAMYLYWPNRRDCTNFDKEGSIKLNNLIDSERLDYIIENSSELLNLAQKMSEETISYTISENAIINAINLNISSDINNPGIIYRINFYENNCLQIPATFKVKDNIFELISTGYSQC